MKKFKYFRFFILLLIGGIFFAGVLAVSGQMELPEEYSIMLTDAVDGLPESFSFIKDWRETNIMSKENAVEASSMGENAVGADDMGDKSAETLGASEAGFGEAKTAEAAKGESELIQEEEKVYTFEIVDASYMEDALFIGDSRTVGLYIYSDFEQSDYFCSSGLTLYKLTQAPKRKPKDGNWPEDLETFLHRKQYKKVYIMLGINEMGISSCDYFIEHYQEIIALIQKLQPDAIIYLQSIMKVTAKRSGAGGSSINNPGIDERNAEIEKLADQKNIFYLDVNSALCDEDGNLKKEYTSDGVHLYAKSINLWTDYLLQHAIVK